DFGPAAVGGSAVDEPARRVDRLQVHAPALGFGTQHAGDLQDRQLRDRGRDPPVDDGVDGLVDVDPAGEEAGLLPTAFGPGRLGHETDVASEVEAHRLTAAAGAQAGVAEDLPPGGGEIGLFDQFPGRRVEGGLTVDVEQSCRDLPQAGPHRVPV